jgi:hypothetical protein
MCLAKMFLKLQKLLRRQRLKARTDLGKEIVIVACARASVADDLPNSTMVHDPYSHVIKTHHDIKDGRVWHSRDRSYAAFRPLEPIGATLSSPPRRSCRKFELSPVKAIIV